MASRAHETRPYGSFKSTHPTALQETEYPGGTKDVPDVAKVARDLLGADGKLKVVPVHSVNLDLKEGYPHSTTGIPYAIEGTASLIATTVAAGLLESPDPIKVILSTEVHRKHRIILTRKFVVGGGAQITPERAPARTVSIQEDVREITMERYGGDLEMNLNLFLRPEDAKEELDLKMNAQKLQLENKLIELGYDAVMEGATNIVSAIMRSNPTYGAMQFQGGPEDQGWEVRVAADRIYANQIFGALQKHKYAIPNLLASVKYASAYMLGSVQNPTIVLPHGIANILKYARPESMRYDISGVKTRDGKKLSMEMERSFVDPISGANILVHYPRPSYEMGSIRPRVGPGGLSGTCKVVIVYKNLQRGQSIVNFKTGGLHMHSPSSAARAAGAKLRNGKSTSPSYADLPYTDSPEEEEQQQSVQTVESPTPNEKKVDKELREAIGTGTTIIRIVECSMASCIVAAPKGQAGRLLVGYPMTGVSTSQATETLRIQLRTYLGACITDPENIFVLPNVTFQGIISDTLDAHKLEDICNLTYDQIWKHSDSMVDLKYIYQHLYPDYRHLLEGMDPCAVGHQGTVYDAQDKTKKVHMNAGHFGSLDSLENHGRVWGQQVYSEDATHSM